MADARACTTVLENFVKLLARTNACPGLRAGRTLAAVRIFWPSKKFHRRGPYPGRRRGVCRPRRTTRRSGPCWSGSKRIPNGSAAAQRIRCASRRSIAPRRSCRSSKRRRSAARVRPAAARASSIPMPRMPTTGRASSSPRDRSELFEEMSKPVTRTAVRRRGGGAVGLARTRRSGGPSATCWAASRPAARRLANFATYYADEERAGTVGAPASPDCSAAPPAQPRCAAPPRRPQLRRPPGDRGRPRLPAGTPA